MTASPNPLSALNARLGTPLQDEAFAEYQAGIAADFGTKFFSRLRSAIIDDDYAAALAVARTLTPDLTLSMRQVREGLALSYGDGDMDGMLVVAPEADGDPRVARAIVILAIEIWSAHSLKPEPPGAFRP